MDRIALIVRAGSSPLPYFAEYAYFLWGEANYDSEGNCKRPTDREWTELFITNRATDESISIVSKSETERIFEITSDSNKTVKLAAILTAVRTSGSIWDKQSGSEIPLEIVEDETSREQWMQADRVVTMFENPILKPFDSHGWWGGWKWVGNRASDFTMGLRLTMKAVEEGKADRELLEWLEEWRDEPPKPFHVDGVRHAIAVLTSTNGE